MSQLKKKISFVVYLSLMVLSTIYIKLGYIPCNVLYKEKIH